MLGMIEIDRTVSTLARNLRRLGVEGQDARPYQR
jgi:hypothetical protein